MNLRCLSNSMISDQSTSLFMLRSNALTQQITLLSCSLFLVSSILFLPIFNRHPVDTVLIPFANIEKYPSNVGSLGFTIGGCLAVINTLFLEWAKRHEGQRADRESQELLAVLSPEKQNMISDWHARVVKRMETDRRKTPALASSMHKANRVSFNSLITMVRACSTSQQLSQKSFRSDGSEEPSLSSQSAEGKRAEVKIVRPKACYKATVADMGRRDFPSSGASFSPVAGTAVGHSAASTSSDAHQARDGSSPAAIVAAQTWLAKAEGATGLEEQV